MKHQCYRFPCYQAKCGWEPVHSGQFLLGSLNHLCEGKSCFFQSYLCGKYQCDICHLSLGQKTGLCSYSISSSSSRGNLSEKLPIFLIQLLEA